MSLAPRTSRVLRICREFRAVKRHSVDFMRKTAAERGGLFLSETYANNYTYYEWQCGSGHRWSAQSSEILKGRWCPACCYAKKRVSIARLREHAQSRDGKCLALEYKNNHTKILWQCAKGHEWMACPRDVISKRQRWCPKCGKQESRPELQLYELVRSLYPSAKHKVKRLLISPRLELDIYVPELKKAVEYDGDYWHATPEAQERDLRKNLECAQVGISLKRIKHSEFKLSANRDRIVLDLTDWLKA